MSEEFQERIERLRTLAKLMKTLPDDVVYLMDSAESPEEMSLVNSVVLELLHLSSRVQRGLASKVVKRLVPEQ